MMNRLSRAISSLPPWVTVLGLSAVVGALSAVFAVAVYRDLVVTTESPVPVPSKSND